MSGDKFGCGRCGALTHGTFVHDLLTFEDEWDAPVDDDEEPCQPTPPTATTGAPAAATSPRTDATGASGAEVGE